jgi:hypothetical protein
MAAIPPHPTPHPPFPYGTPHLTVFVICCSHLNYFLLFINRFEEELAAAKAEAEQQKAAFSDAAEERLGSAQAAAQADKKRLEGELAAVKSELERRVQLAEAQMQVSGLVYAPELLMFCVHALYIIDSADLTYALLFANFLCWRLHIWSGSITNQVSNLYVY